MASYPLTKHTLHGGVIRSVSKGEDEMMGEVDLFTSGAVLHRECVNPCCLWGNAGMAMSILTLCARLRVLLCDVPEVPKKSTACERYGVKSAIVCSRLSVHPVRN